MSHFIPLLTAFFMEGDKSIKNCLFLMSARIAQYIHKHHGAEDLEQ